MKSFSKLSYVKYVIINKLVTKRRFARGNAKSVREKLILF